MPFGVILMTAVCHVSYVIKCLQGLKRYMQKGIVLCSDVNVYQEVYCAGKLCPLLISVSFCSHLNVVLGLIDDSGVSCVILHRVYGVKEYICKTEIFTIENKMHKVDHKAIFVFFWK